MSSLKLQPNGEVIRWAREISRKSISEVATVLKVTPDDVRSWEIGTSPIRLTKLKRLGSLYHRPIAFFFAHTPPQVNLITPAFRTFDSIKQDTLSEKTLLALRKSTENRELYKFLLEELEEKYSFDFPKVSINDDPDLFSKRIRRRLHIPNNIHDKFKDKYTALKFWINLVEQHGLLIFQYSLPERERGFCLSENENLPPVIVMNSGEYSAGRIFTIFHELCHLLIKENPQSISHRKLEEYCNNFAGAFLVQKENLMESKNREKFLEEFSDFWLDRLAGEFRVSHDVVLRRLLIFKDITQPFYRKKIKEIELAREKKKVKKDENSGFLPPARKALMNVGVTMASKLFQARDVGVISTATLVRSFDTTSHTLKNVNTELTSLKNKKIEQ